jgi:hypothetical protein
MHFWHVRVRVRVCTCLRPRALEPSCAGAIVCQNPT